MGIMQEDERAAYAPSALVLELRRARVSTAHW